LYLIDLFKSEETKTRIGDGVKEGWRRRRQTIKIQEGCHVEWCNVIADAARVGFYGEEELYWNSYELLQEELEQKWIAERVRRKQSKSHVKSPNPRAPHSIEQRKKIAEAIRTKWADPVRPLSYIYIYFDFFYMPLKRQNKGCMCLFQRRGEMQIDIELTFWRELHLLALKAYHMRKIQAHSYSYSRTF
jgi:hypothetical protein